MDLTLLVLAAGMGSRYGGLKQIDPVGPSGETIIDYSIYDAKRAGFNKVVFVIRKELEKDFKEVFFNKLNKHIKVDYVFQELNDIPDGLEVPSSRQKPWGTAHAVLVSAPKVKEPFAVINADDFYGFESFQLAADFLKQKTQDNRYALIGYQLKNTMSKHGHVARGICEIDHEGYLQNVVERTKIFYDENNKIVFEDENGDRNSLTGDEIVSMNLWAFYPSVFDFANSYFKDFIRENADNPKAEFYIPTLIDKMIKANETRVKVITTAEKWFGVTYKDDKPDVENKVRSLIEQGKYPGKIW